MKQSLVIKVSNDDPDEKWDGWPLRKSKFGMQPENCSLHEAKLSNKKKLCNDDPDRYWWVTSLELQALQAF